MEFNLAPGIKGYAEIVVSENDTAVKYGSGLLEVFATPAMIALMEKTAQLSVQGKLPKGYITLGTEICVKHLKPTLTGMCVKCSSELIDSTRKKLEFKVLVYDEKGTIGEGIHKRHIVHAEEFLNAIKSTNQ
ncbi:MAG: thioesterase family protein [Lentimicrobium sp.]|nr:thioesterase family protein [Lentimicrobium sp.]